MGRCGITEGFVDYVFEDEKDNSYLFQYLLTLLIIKSIFIFIVARFIWPRVMPNILTGVKKNPGFLTVFGLSIMIQLLY